MEIAIPNDIRQGRSWATCRMILIRTRTALARTQLEATIYTFHNRGTVLSTSIRRSRNKRSTCQLTKDFIQQNLSPGSHNLIDGITGSVQTMITVNLFASKSAKLFNRLMPYLLTCSMGGTRRTSQKRQIAVQHLLALQSGYSERRCVRKLPLQLAKI